MDKLEDELLNDDFEEEDDDSKSLLDSTHDLLKSPDSSKSTTPEQTTPQAKKVSLKRNISIPIPIIDSKSTSDEATESAAAEPEKKVVKLAVLTEMERLELRAKKFGGSTAAAATPASTTNVGSQDKKDARAARFGVSAVTSSAAPSDEILKKRAERFGAISGEVKKVELNEKLQKRKERFGITATTTASDEKVTSPAVTSEYAEKERLRLERFKTTA